MKFAIKHSDITHLTLHMLLHYLGKLKIQIFCRYSADTEENANKLHFECTDFNYSIYACNCMVSVFTYLSFSVFEIFKHPKA